METDELGSLVLADAFGTYALGPAYACAAIRLRLDPWVGPSVDYPGLDIERACVILSMLRSMDQAHSRFRSIVDGLEQSWEMSVKTSPSLLDPLWAMKDHS